jgi:hypothetical protein
MGLERMTALAGFARGRPLGRDHPRHPVARLAARVVARAVLLLAVAAVVAAIAGDPGSGIRLMFSLLPISCFGLTALAGWFLLRRGDNAFGPVGAVTVIVSVVAAAVAVAWLWTVPVGDEDGTGVRGLGTAAEVGFVCALALGHVSLLLAARRKTDGRVVTALISAAVGLTVGVGVMITLAITQGYLGADGSFWQMIGATAIVTLILTGLVAAARCVEPRDSADER